MEVSPSNSPEFEFWKIRNPSQQTTLHSADQLFSDGILLPLRLLNTPPDITITITTTPSNSITPNPGLKTTLTASKRWKHIFKNNPATKDKDTKKRNAAGIGSSTPELNINLWPFSRSRSASNSASRPRTVVANRKVSSAPCSRSNSTGDKYRKWPSSPGRGGVYLGRSSPVWKAKRFGQSRGLHDSLVQNTAEKGFRPTKNSTTGTGATGKVLNLNVPTCIGYRKRMGCRSDVFKDNNTGHIAGGKATATSMSADCKGGASGLFNLRSLFTKKVF